MHWVFVWCYLFMITTWPIGDWTIHGTGFLFDQITSDNWLDALKKYDWTPFQTHIIFVVTSICICCTGVFISTWSRSSCCDREPDVGKETLHGAEGNAYWYDTKKHMTLTWPSHDSQMIIFVVKFRLIYEIFDWRSWHSDFSHRRGLSK